MPEDKIKSSSSKHHRSLARRLKANIMFKPLPLKPARKCRIQATKCRQELTLVVKSLKPDLETPRMWSACPNLERQPRPIKEKLNIKTNHKPFNITEES